MMRKLFALAAFIIASLASQAHAQTALMYCEATTNPPSWLPCNASNPLQIAGTFSATLGGFQTSTSGAFTAVTSGAASSASTALPTGTVTTFHNTGTTAVSIVESVGASTATINKLVIQPGSQASRVNGTFTTWATINNGGDATANVVIAEGGSGLGNDSGGGSAGGGGGGGNVNVTQWATTNLGLPTAWGVAPTGNVPGFNGNILASVLPTGAATNSALTTINSTLGSPMQNSGGTVGATVVNGGDVTQGNTTDAPCTLPATTTACTIEALQKAIANAILAAPTLGSASGGWTPVLLNALSTTVKSIKNSAAGQLGFLHCGNTNSSQEYVQIFDVATSGGVTLGTTTPVLSIPIPATNSDGFTLSLVGIQFANGIQIAATTTATGSTAPSTALDCNAGRN